MPIEFNITAALFLGMIVLQMIAVEFPQLRYVRPPFYFALQVGTAALAGSAIAYISIFVLR